MKIVLVIYVCFSLGTLFGWLLCSFFAANRRDEECANCLAHMLEKGEEQASR